MQGITYEEQKRILESFKREYGFIRHQLDSYDHFMHVSLQQIVAENNTFSVTDKRSKKMHEFVVTNVKLRKPIFREYDGTTHNLLPGEARVRGLTYCNPVMVDVLHNEYNGKQIVKKKKYRELLLCQIPTMVRSKCCYLRGKEASNTYFNVDCSSDLGGYFIVNGKEKVIVSQQVHQTNFPYVHALNSGRYSYYCEVRSLYESKIRSTSTLKLYISKRRGNSCPKICVHIPFLTKCSVPLCAIFKVLGISDVDEMVRYISRPSDEQKFQHLIYHVLHSADPVSLLERDAIIQWLGKNGTNHVTMLTRKHYVEHIISNEFLPHMGLDQSSISIKGKLFYFAFVVRKLLLVFNGDIQEDDRDDFAFKRLNCPGMLLSLLFRQHFRHEFRLMGRQLQRNLDMGKFINFADVVSTNITVAIKYALSTGNWGIQKSATGQSGVAQVLSRLSAISTLSHLRHINTPINREGKIIKPRQLHESQWGLVCSAETPEGAPCGLVKNLTKLAHVRLSHDSQLLKQWIYNLGIKPLIFCESGEMDQTMLFLNGVILGITANPRVIVTQLKTLRQSMDIPFDTTIVFDSKHQGDIYVNNDTGAVLRPLLVVSKLPLTRTILNTKHLPIAQMFRQLLFHRCIQYVDKSEERFMAVADSMEMLEGVKEGDGAPSVHWDMVEIHPIAAMFGVVASLIPFANHNQSPRNIYGSCMLKQSVGINVLHQRTRIDTVTHRLWYPQRPLMKTITYDLLDLSDLPDGTNCVVAICCYLGFNQEDSIIINKASIERGLYAQEIHRTYKSESKGEGRDHDIFCKPGLDVVGRLDANYDHLDESGLPTLHDVLNPGDVIIGKCVKTTALGTREMIMRDRSTVVTGHDRCVVTDIILYSDKDGNKSVLVKTRARRNLQVGDKLSSKHGQKGTIGLVLAQRDMPFTTDGMVPDIIINTHAIPSRMTIAQLMEMLAGPVAEHLDMDATAFSSLTVPKIQEMLKRHGYNSLGDHTMMDGRTGEMLPGKIFMGPAHYMSLKHQVIDKVHGRSRGPVTVLTRQPVEGRSRLGGLRIGEMEKDAIITHGAMNFARDRLMYQSDLFQVWVCVDCGTIARAPTPHKFGVARSPAFCVICDKSHDIIKIDIPYATKLLIHEMMAMHIAVKFDINKETANLRSAACVT